MASSSVAHLPIRPEWLALGKEEILEPDLPIVDPHHHIWDNPGNRYLFHDLLEDLNTGHNIRATAFAECHAMYRQDGDTALRSLGETEFANGNAAMAASGQYGPCKVAAAIIGHVDLREGKRARALLEKHVEVSDGRFRGIRNGSVWHPDPTARGSTQTPPRGLLQDASFREGFAALASLGLTFDAWMYHTQLSEGVELARSFPDTTIVLTHLGAPLCIGPYAGKRDEVFRDWRKGMQELATCPNVNVKLGGFGMRLFGFDFTDKPTPPTSADLAAGWGPYIEACVEAFGASRCMFESNFPVDKGTCSYAALWNAYKRVAAKLSPSEKADLFSGTACRVYGITLD